MERTINFEGKNTIPFTDEQLQEMAWRYERGETAVELSDHYGICRTAVTSRLVTMGVKMRRAGSRKRAGPEVVQQVVEMRNKNKAWSEIERDLGFTAAYLKSLHTRHKRQNLVSGGAE